MHQNLIKLALCTLVLAFGSGNAKASPTASPMPQIVDLAPKNVDIDNGETLAVESGKLIVPESRANPTSNTVTLPFYRLRSTSSNPAAPIFLLAGGPGSSWIDQVTNAENYDEVAFYRTIADVVIFDQRGGGHSEPRMTCQQSAKTPADQSFDLNRDVKLMRSLSAQCRDVWLGKGIDLSAYNTEENAADVDALRRALGYDRMTLIGGSYGSHLALQIMRLYPQRVARTLIYGVEGPNDTWDDPQAILATMDRIAAAAEASPELGPHIPTKGLLNTLSSVIKRLDAAPVTVEVDSGESPQQVIVNGDLVRFIATRSAGRRSRLNAWPEMILAMNGGDYSIAAEAGARFKTLSVQNPVHYTMDCASGISSEKRQRFERAPARELLGDINAEYVGLCDIWPTTDAGATYRSATHSSVPTLILQGSWDMSAPMENAQAVARSLSAAQLVTVEGGTHGALYNLLEHWPPMHGKLARFLKGESVDFPAIVPMPPPIFKVYETKAAGSLAQDG